MGQRIPVEQVTAKVPTEAERKAHELTSCPLRSMVSCLYQASSSSGSTQEDGEVS